MSRVISFKKYLFGGEGDTREDVLLRAVGLLLDGLKLASCSVVFGGVTAAALAGTLTAFLFGVRAHDVVTFTVAPVLLGVVAFMAVVRFLSYLDLRIRHEGWEVELLMRAEAQRLAVQLE